MSSIMSRMSWRRIPKKSYEIPSSFQTSIPSFGQNLDDDDEEKREESVDEVVMDRRVHTALSITILQSKLEVTPATKIQTVLEDKEAIKIFINKLMNVDMEAAKMMQFINAIEEWESIISKKVRNAEGKTLIGIFVTPGSPYEVQGIPEAEKQSLLSYDFSMFEPVKYFLIDQLALDCEVMQVLRDISSHNN